MEEYNEDDQTALRYATVIRCQAEQTLIFKSFLVLHNINYARLKGYFEAYVSKVLHTADYLIIDSVVRELLYFPSFERLFLSFSKYESQADPFVIFRPKEKFSIFSPPKEIEKNRKNSNIKNSFENFQSVEAKRLIKEYSSFLEKFLEKEVRLIISASTDIFQFNELAGTQVNLDDLESKHLVVCAKLMRRQELIKELHSPYTKKCLDLLLGT